MLREKWQSRTRHGVGGIIPLDWQHWKGGNSLMDAAEIRAAIDGATAADRVGVKSRCRNCEL